MKDQDVHNLTPRFNTEAERIEYEKQTVKKETNPKEAPRVVDWATVEHQEKRDTVKKETNPKDAVGIAKVPRSTVSAPVIAEVGLAMMEGARKYGRHNYRAAGVRASVYYDACCRHMDDWWEGEDLDPDSQLSHVTKAIASLTVLRDSMIQGNWVDDRPPPSPKGWLAALNEKAKDILERYPDAVPAVVATDMKDK